MSRHSLEFHDIFFSLGSRPHLPNAISKRSWQVVPLGVFHPFFLFGISSFVLSSVSTGTTTSAQTFGSKMTLPELLNSLTDAEREYIAHADYGRDADQHRNAIDSLISREGHVDLESEIWYPYEVIELSKNILSKGHEREFSACLGIVIMNVRSGADNRNDLDWLMATFTQYSPKLSESLVEMLTDLLTEPQAEQGDASKPDTAVS